MSGRAAAELFYDENRFVRSGAVPGPVRKTLFGEGGVQGLDDWPHKERKALFMSVVTPDRADELEASTGRCWDSFSSQWTDVVLFDEAAVLLTRAVTAWAGTPLPAAGERALASSLVSMVDGFGTLGPRNWRARMARSRVEMWARRVIEDSLVGPPSVARTFAESLPTRIAAVELINVIRPTVALTWFFTFAADALHGHPDVVDLDAYAHEVRRYYPFAPFLAARVRGDFTFEGVEFPRGRLVLLDLYGTNHDPSLWPDPFTFDPQRFVGRTPHSFELIPQGGGDPYEGHRCAGEGITMRLLKQAIDRLSKLDYFVPPQDLEIPLDRIPTRPRSGFLLSMGGRNLSMSGRSLSMGGRSRDDRRIRPAHHATHW